MSDYLDRVEAQLAELTEEGARQRRRPRRPAPPPRGGGRGPRRPRRGAEALAVLAAVGVAAAVVAIVVVNLNGGKGHPTAASGSQTSTRTHATTTTSGTTSTSQTAAGPPPPPPAHFAPQSFTAIGELTWWLLGAGSCPAGETAPCGSIIRTTDGGRGFTAIHAPAAPFVSSGGSGSTGYSQIRFADAHNGFAYGPDLYATHDGGTTWQQVNVGGTVTDLAISAGTAYAVVVPSGGSGRLMRSPTAHNGWTPVSGAGTVSGGLWSQGSEVIVQSGVGTGAGGNVLVSHDGGTSFTASPAPSPGLPCDFAAPEPPVVWAHCATGTESGVWHSSDDGAHFTIAAGTGTSLKLSNSAPFAAASGSTAVVGAQDKIYRSDNSGALWSPVGPSGVAQWAYLGFTDTTHGVALGYVGRLTPANERLYYTTDGGQSYHQVPLP